MGQEKGWNLPPTIMGLDFVPGASLERRPPGSATKHMWLERKGLGLGLGQRPAFSFSFLIPQQAKHMFFPYRGEIVPRVSKSLGHEAGTARRALGRKLGSAGSHSWKLDQAELADTLQEDGKAPGCWVLMPGSLNFSGWAPWGDADGLSYGWGRGGGLFSFSCWAGGAKNQEFARGRRPTVWG